jgi:hypothetical protein
MRFGKILIPCLLSLLLLSSAENISSFNSGTQVAYPVSDYIPIKWALVVLGGFDYFKNPPGQNAIQKVEHWIESVGVPYDIIKDDDIEAPTDAPLAGRYPLQYANGTTRYGVLVIIMNNHTDTTAANSNYIYWAVGNGTNAVIFGTAAQCVPVLLDISPSSVSLIADYQIIQINCTVLKTFSDGIIEYDEGTVEIINLAYFLHANISDIKGKTVWYTMHSNTGRNWIGMMNTTYGYGKVFWSTVVPSCDGFFHYGTFSTSWETENLKFVAHAINFMFEQVKSVDLGLQGYKEWGGAITYRLDQDTLLGIVEQNETALKAGWYVDVVISALGYYALGGTLSDGMPEGYNGAPSSKVKYGNWTNLVVSTEPPRLASRTFIVFSSRANGNYDTMKVDWNQNKNFSDDPSFGIWENMTSNVTGLMGTYYWSYIDNWTNPTILALNWWCPLRERISDFSWWKEMGQQGYIRYGFHSYDHAPASTGTLGCPSEVQSEYVYWNGTYFIMNQTWIEQKFTEARDELAYCLGSTGYGFEADRGLVSHGGNQYNPVVDAALSELDWVYLTYGDNTKNEPGWFLYSDSKTAMTCGGSMGRPYTTLGFEALKDAVKTLFPIFGVYEHNEGYYNLDFDVNPSDTAYTDMFCFAHLDDSFEFWSNARYMKTNTVNAYYKNNKIVLEYKANSTLKDYVWRFPVELKGKYFNGFSDNRTVGKIKRIDGKYVYVEFSEGGNEKIEATYGPNPHIYQTSTYIENITQTYTPKNLTLQLWNTSGTMDVEVNCTRLGQPDSVKCNGTPIEFNYDNATKISSFNVTFNGLVTVEMHWEYAPPDPPTLVSPSPASRFNPSKSITFTWNFNDPDLGDSQTAYRFQLSDDYYFTSLIVDDKVDSSSTQTTQTLPSNVSLYYWRVETWDNRSVEGDWSDGQEVIVDELLVTIAPRAATVTAGTQVDFAVSAVYAYDNRSVPEFTVNILRDGTHFATNNFTDTCNTDGTHQYTTENITEKTYGLTAFASNSSTVTWNSESFIQTLIEWITSNSLILFPIIGSVIVLTYVFIRERRKHKTIEHAPKKRE